MRNAPSQNAMPSFAYGRETFSATIGGKRYREKIGIRIEDDLLITGSGHVNLSSRIPKTVGEIEALMSSAKVSDII